MKTTATPAPNKANIQSDYLEIINEFSNQILSLDTEDDILWYITRNVIRRLDLPDCVIYMHDEGRNLLIQKAAYGRKNPKEREIFEQRELSPDQGIVGWVFRNKKPLIVDDTTSDDRYFHDEEFRLSELAIPIRSGARIIGVLDSEHPEKNFFTDLHLKFFSVIVNITGKRIHFLQTLNKLKQSEQRFQKLVESLNDGIMIVNTKDEIQYVNEQICKMTSYALDELIGKKAGDLLMDEENRSKLYSEMKKRLRGKAGSYEVQCLTKNNKHIWALIHATPLLDANGKVDGVIRAITDITLVKEAADQVQKTQASLTSIVENSHLGFLLLDGNYQILFFNQKVQEGFKALYDVEIKSGASINSLIPVADAERFHVNFQQALEGKKSSGIRFRKFPDGSEKYFEVSYLPVKDDSGKTDRVIITLENITEWQLADQKTKQSLQEKEMLLREIHHRVKNNLAVVSGLLHLQGEYSNDPGFRSIINECTGRIQAIAMIHEELYGHKQLSRIDFQQYLRQLVDSIEKTHNQSGKKITVGIHTRPIHLDINTAMPCGLIVNELLTNAYKHAFVTCDSGKIELYFDQEGEQLKLIVADDGNGMKHVPTSDHTNSLGMFLIFSLAQQLKAQIKIDSLPGTRFEFRFPAA